MEINYDTQHAAGRNSYHEFVKMNVWINWSMSTAKEMKQICDFSLTFSVCNRVKANITYKDNRVSDEERDCQGGTATSWFSCSRLKNIKKYDSQQTELQICEKNILKNVLYRSLCISCGSNLSFSSSPG